MGSPTTEGEDGSLSSLLGLALIGLFGILLALDVLTTQQILQMGGVEYNLPMVAVVANPFLHGMVKTLFFVGIIGWAGWCEHRIPNAGMCILSAISGWFLYVVAFNLQSLFMLPGL